MRYYGGGYQPRRAIMLPGMSPVVKMLMIINGAVFVLMFLIRPIYFFSIDYLSLIPYSVTHQFQLWRLVTYMFIHGGLMHILLNMLFLWWFGSELERLWGPVVFLKYYFVTGIGGALFHLLLPNSTVPVIGASGAVMGILIAYGLKWPNRVVLLWFILPVKMKWIVIFSVIIEFIGAINTSGASSGIAHLAHLGGMVVGFIYLNLNRIKWIIKDIFYKRRAAKKRSQFKIYNGEKDPLDSLFRDDDDDEDFTIH